MIEYCQTQQARCVIFVKLDELKQMAAKVSNSPARHGQQEYQDVLRSFEFDSINLYQELEMSSRYVNTHQDVSFSHTTVQLHSHAFYELLCCRSNCGVEYLVGSERYRLQKGDIVIVAPGVSHRPILPENMASPLPPGCALDQRRICEPDAAPLTGSSGWSDAADKSGAYCRNEMG